MNSYISDRRKDVGFLKKDLLAIERSSKPDSGLREKIPKSKNF